MDLKIERAICWLTSPLEKKNMNGTSPLSFLVHWVGNSTPQSEYLIGRRLQQAAFLSTESPGAGRWGMCAGGEGGG